MKRYIYFITLLMACMLSSVNTDAQTTEPVSHSLTESSDSVATSHRGGLKGFINRAIDYFGKANQPKPDGHFDISFIGGPYYSSDTKFGIGVVAAGQYGESYFGNDSATALRSEVAIFLNLSISGFAQLGIRGTHIFPKDHSRINYDIDVSNFPNRFWGIGFDAGKYRDGYTKFDQISLEAKASYELHLAHNIYLGPALGYSLISAKKIEHPNYWEHQVTTSSYIGFGGVLSWDSRDNTTAPTEGLLIRAEATYYPSAISRPALSFTNIDLSASIYRKIWRNGVFAGRIHTKMTTGDVPWSMMATFGGSSTMRGYYEGRFRDKDEIDLTLELRQRVWRRSGIAFWVGAGTVFPRFDAMRWRKVLPNCGIGYRWEFKKNSNVRVDFGIGRGETGFVFNINEAF